MDFKSHDLKKYAYECVCVRDREGGQGEMHFLECSEFLVELKLKSSPAERNLYPTCNL